MTFNLNCFSWVLTQYKVGCHTSFWQEMYYRFQIRLYFTITWNIAETTILLEYFIFIRADLINFIAFECSSQFFIAGKWGSTSTGLQNQYSCPQLSHYGSLSPQIRPLLEPVFGLHIIEPVNNLLLLSKNISRFDRLASPPVVNPVKRKSWMNFLHTPLF